MNCRTAERLLSQQQDGMLPGKSVLDLTLHLKSCPACRRYQQTLHTLHTDLSALAQHAPTRSGAAQRAIVQWMETEPPLAIPPLRASWLRPALAWTLTLILLTAGAATLRLWRNPQGAAESSAIGIQTPQRDIASSPSVSAPAGEDGGALPGITPLNGTGKSAAPRQATFHPRLRSSGAPPVLLAADMEYLNTDPAVTLACWTQKAPDEIAAMMTQWRASVCGGDEFVNVPLPQIAGQDDRAVKAAAAQFKQEAETVDERLAKKVSLGEKGIAFSDLCKRLQEQTGIELTANPSVADDKVTLFCKERSLRDIMRQVNRLFGYLWNRTGKEGAFHYELTQSVRAQLAEEELRNRDRDEALLALDREMERYRKYLNLTPEQAREQAETAGPEDKAVLESLAGSGWGPAHLYFGLSPQDMDALRSGQELSFAQQPDSAQARPLSQEMSDGILRSLDKLRASVGQNGALSIGPPENVPNGQMLSDVPGASSRASLQLDTSNLGQMTLSGNSGASLKSSQPGVDGNMSASSATVMLGGPLGVGISPSVGSPKNAAANAKLAKDPAFRPHTSLSPQSSSLYNAKATRITTADVEEALFKATGKDILADYYTRLYEPALFTVRDKTLFDALNLVSDTMQDRWNWDNGFLQFRSTGFFNDRLKEVPNRLLTRWAESRKQQGALTLDELIEIAQLTDRQLNAQTMAQGAQILYGLNQWQQGQNMREDWRYLARLSPQQRKAVQTEKGLPYMKLPVTLQERFLTLLYGAEADTIHLESGDVTDAFLKVEYALPKQPEAKGAAPEPKIVYQISGGASVHKQTRTVTPTSVEVASPGEVRMQQNNRQNP